MSLSGVNESYQMGLFQILASILHLGNVEVKDRDADSSIIPVSFMFTLKLKYMDWHFGPVRFLCGPFYCCENRIQITEEMS